MATSWDPEQEKIQLKVCGDGTPVTGSRYCVVFSFAILNQCMLINSSAYNYLLGIAQIDETYENVSSVFKPVAESLKEMKAEGIRINGRHVSVFICNP